MTITIDLPPATEEQLRAQAEATGKNISTLVVEAVEARLALAQLPFKDILCMSVAGRGRRHDPQRQRANSCRGERRPYAKGDPSEVSKSDA
ncbi:MAG TPA: hypothetical protein VFW87_08950 [Pirellulales bacterium]|nr:hypothetical protein [Pirellulales bacterium]